jgi:DNA-binding CsgD family transcriptional regulator
VIAGVASDVVRAAHEARSLPEFRARVLAALPHVVRFDVGLFHALSPRVPLSTGALVGIDPATIATGMQDWDRLAVELGALREHAMSHDGVAADHEVIPITGKARDRFRRAIGRALRVESLVIAHLSMHGAVRAAVVLARKAPDPFDARVLAALRELVPLLSIADALHESLDGAERAKVPIALRCEDQRLTPRQREVVTLVAHGHTNAEIARALAISPNTLRNALAEVFRRLGAANRADVVRLAVLRA